MIISLLLLVVLGVVTWCVASEGAWGSMILFYSVLLSGLLAMNYFEPLATSLQGMAPSWAYRFDFIALMLIFTVCVIIFRVLTVYLLPNYIEIHTYAYEAGRWIFGFMTGWVTMAFLLTALHTAPLPREFLGFTPENNNFFGAAAPDRQWLGFVQHLSEKNLSRFGKPRIFDGPSQTVIGVENKIWPSFPIKYATRREEGDDVLLQANSKSGGRGWDQQIDSERESRSNTGSSRDNTGQLKSGTPAF